MILLPPTSSRLIHASTTPAWTMYNQHDSDASQKVPSLLSMYDSDCSVAFFIDHVYSDSPYLVSIFVLWTVRALDTFCIHILDSKMEEHGVAGRNWGCNEYEGAGFAASLGCPYSVRSLMTAEHGTLATREGPPKSVTQPSPTRPNDSLSRLTLIVFASPRHGSLVQRLCVRSCLTSA